VDVPTELSVKFVALCVVDHSRDAALAAVVSNVGKLVVTIVGSQPFLKVHVKPLVKFRKWCKTHPKASDRGFRLCPT
jgi:hypothetical protein